MKPLCADFDYINPCHDVIVTYTPSYTNTHTLTHPILPLYLFLSVIITADGTLSHTRTQTLTLVTLSVYLVLAVIITADGTSWVYTSVRSSGSRTYEPSLQQVTLPYVHLLLLFSLKEIIQLSLTNPLFQPSHSHLFFPQCRIFHLQRTSKKIPQRHQSLLLYLHS